MFIFALLIVGILGAVIGSFLNVVILRLPRNKTLGGRSQCTHCKHILSWRDLVPVLSFIFLFGRCRYCKTPISKRYVIIECVTSALFICSFLYTLPANTVQYIELVYIWIVISVALCVFVIDLEHFLILDSVLLPASIMVLATHIILDILTGSPLWQGQSLMGLEGALAAALSFYLVWFFSKGTWMGFGDVKFVGLMGLVLGLLHVWIAIFLAFCIGALYAIPLLVFGGKTLKSKLPFGTFLAVSLVITLLYGESIASWYLRLIGLG